MEVLPEFMGMLSNPQLLTTDLQKEIIAVLHGKAKIVAKDKNTDGSTSKDRDDDCRLVNISKAALLLRLGRNSIYKFIKEGRLDVVEVRAGRGKLISMRSIIAFSRGERPANEQTKAIIAESKARYAQSHCK